MAERKTRAQRQPRPGSRFLSQVFGDNLRAVRARQDLLQDDIAERMVQLGHEGWSRATVSNVERARRVVSLDEFLSLCLIVGAKTVDMLDPHDTPVDHGAEEPMWADSARAWLRGDMRAVYLPGQAIVELPSSDARPMTHRLYTEAPEGETR